MKYNLSVQTEEGILYYESFDESFPVSIVGTDVFVPGEGMGWWRVVKADISLPSMMAMVPTFWVTLTVVWSEFNSKPAPIYDEEEGWKFERKS